MNRKKKNRKEFKSDVRVELVSEKMNDSVFFFFIIIKATLVECNSEICNKRSDLCCT